MLTLTVTSVGWRPVGSNEDFVQTSDLGVFSLVAFNKLSDEPDAIATAIRASLTIEDDEAVSQLVRYQTIGESLEWRFEFEDVGSPLTVELLLERVDETSGGIELMCGSVPRDLLGEIGMG